MLNRQIVSISLPKSVLGKLERIRKKERKTRSQVIRELIDRYETEKMWGEIFTWGEKTARKFNIKSEGDVLRIIND